MGWNSFDGGCLRLFCRCLTASGDESEDFYFKTHSKYVKKGTQNDQHGNKRELKGNQSEPRDRQNMSCGTGSKKYPFLVPRSYETLGCF